MMKKVMKYIKMCVPRFGTFTNGPYDVRGIMIFGTLYGKVVKSYYPMVYDVGEFVSLSEYNLSDHDDPQFY